METRKSSRASKPTEKLIAFKADLESRKRKATEDQSSEPPRPEKKSHTQLNAEMKKLQEVSSPPEAETKKAPRDEFATTVKKPKPPRAPRVGYLNTNSTAKRGLTAVFLHVDVYKNQSPTKHGAGDKILPLSTPVKDSFGTADVLQQLVASHHSSPDDVLLPVNFGLPTTTRTPQQVLRHAPFTPAPTVFDPAAPMSPLSPSSPSSASSSASDVDPLPLPTPFR